MTVSARRYFTFRAWAVMAMIGLGLLAGCAGPALSPTIVAAQPTSAPNPGKTSEAPVEVTPAATLPSPGLVEARQIVLEWPRKIREKDSDIVVLSLIADPEGKLTITPETPGSTVEGTPVEIPNVYDTHNVVAVARLDIAGLDSWRDEIREPLRPGQPVTFRWSVRAEESGMFRGVVWLHLEFVPKEGGEVEKVTLLARPIDIEAVTVMGMSGSTARLLAGLGLVASTLLGLPFLQQFAAYVWKRRAPVAKPAAQE